MYGLRLMVAARGPWHDARSPSRNRDATSGCTLKRRDSHDQVTKCVRVSLLVIDRSEIKEFLLRDNSRMKRVYMVVGFKTITDEKIKLYNAEQRRLHADGTIPVKEVVQAGLAAGGLPPVPIPIPNPTGSAEIGATERALYEAVGEGESIFAVQYRKIIRSSLLHQLVAWLRGKSESEVGITEGELASWDGGRALGFKNGGDPDEASTEEEDDDDLFTFPTVSLAAIPVTERGKYDMKTGGDDDVEFIFERKDL
ncbi:uncharacterized protein PAC_19446 [Phialocephala subalpina]|uniref:Uncharacterized protein n=1 Tax=Phialocephala subalpina TaxID=576137 RepID=A0A1L7XWY3_9HELO|nr:uncharacterized protein PAC_19446 [Phialocephala subalpina]